MLPRVHVYFYLLTTALTVYGHESLARMVLHASTCSLYRALLTVWVRVVCIHSMFDFCHRWRLPLGKKLKKQLSVMGMSLRIGMWSPSSLTLKPTVRITLIAASRDSLNPQLSLWGVFFLPPFLTTIRQTANAIEITKHSATTSIGPLKRKCGSDSSKIHFNYLFMYTSVTEIGSFTSFWDPVHSLESALYAAKREFENVSSFVLSKLSFSVMELTNWSL